MENASEVTLSEIKKSLNIQDVNLPDIDHRKKSFSFLEIDAKEKYNLIYLPESEGGEMVIEAEFTNYLDLSRLKCQKVTLIGKFNNIDASGAKIGMLDRRKALCLNIKRNDTKIDSERVE